MNALAGSHVPAHPIHPALAALEERFRRIAALHGSMSMLGWDRSTVMPSGGAAARAEQLATLGVLAHELLCDPCVGDQLADAEAGAARLDAWRAANLREMRRRWQRATALPSDLVDAADRARSACEMCWRDARANDDFASVAPLLERVIALELESATAIGEALSLAPYDALLDANDPGLRDTRVVELFGALQTALPPLLEQALERQRAAPPPLPLDGPFPAEHQRRIGERLMHALGFDFAHGRLDTSHHPFTGGVPDDVRITTRWNEHDFVSGLMAVLHETGHALYERGLPPEWRTQPVGESCGMTIHESQSLLVEMQACRTSEFVAYVAPLLCSELERSGPEWRADNLERHYRRVERGLIRVDADELTYPLHVIVRHRLERELIAGALPVRELPGAWRTAMRELVGMEPSDDRDGCLQDIHWYTGAFGYFPTYTLGALAAAQLFEAATLSDPKILPSIARGEFAPLLGWLRANVHRLGRLHGSSELVERATGTPPGVNTFVRHLRKRYLAEG